MLLNQDIADVEKPVGIYVRLCLPWINFQDYVNIYQSLLLYTQDLRK